MRKTMFMLCMICLYMSCGAVALAQAIPDAELERAVRYQIVDAESLERSVLTITHQQFCSLSNNLMRAYGEEAAAQWAEISALAQDSNQKMCLADGILALYHMGKILDLSTPNSARGDWGVAWGQVDEESAWNGAKGSDYLFPNPNDEVWTGDTWGDASTAATFYAVSRTSLDGRPLFALDGAGSLRLDAPLTIADAVRALVRLGESEQYPFLKGEPVYVSIDEICAHTIDPALYQAPHRLPDATNASFPMWRGFKNHDKSQAYEGIIHSSSGISAQDHRFHESYFRYLSEQGFNFMQLNLDFDTLSYPFFTYEPGRVNLKEVEALDEAIGWGMKFGIHVQLAMMGTPCSYLEQRQLKLETGDWQGTDEDIYTNKEKRQHIIRYWTALATRYADIPNNYLSFAAMNEPLTEGDAKLTKMYYPLVEAIWKVSPDRIVICPIAPHGDDTDTTGRGLAKKGVPLGVHTYAPAHLTFHDVLALDCYPYVPVEWPLVFWDHGMLSKKSGALTIQGDVDKGPLSVNIHNARPGDALLVKADGEEVGTIVLPEGIDYGEPYQGDTQDYYDRLFTVDIPAGTQSIVLQAKGNAEFELKTVIVHSTAGEVRLYPHNVADRGDYHFHSMKEPMPTLVVHEDGTWQNADGRMFEAEDVYRAGHNFSIESVRNAAKKAKVGFIVDEFGIGGKQYDSDAAARYIADMVAFFEQEQIPYCHTYFYGPWHIVNETGEFERLSDPQYISYTLDDGTNEGFYVDQMIMNAFTRNLPTTQTETP